MVALDLVTGGWSKRLGLDGARAGPVAAATQKNASRTGEYGSRQNGSGTGVRCTNLALETTGRRFLHWIRPPKLSLRVFLVVPDAGLRLAAAFGIGRMQLDIMLTL